MEVFIYVADDIQVLAGGKTLLVGLYPDRVVVVQVPKDPPFKPSADTPIGISSLSLMLTVVGLEPGELRVTPRMLLPDGSPSPQQPTPNRVTVVPDGSANLIFKLTPFLVTQGGQYKLLVEIGGKVIEASFEVRIVEVATATA